MDNHRRELIVSSARALDKAKMIRFDERTTYLSPIDVGRIASNFYIKYDTIEVLYMSLTNFKADFKVKVALFMLDQFLSCFPLRFSRNHSLYSSITKGRNLIKLNSFICWLALSVLNCLVRIIAYSNITK